jgi:ATP-dependent DNA helicase RecQ
MIARSDQGIIATRPAPGAFPTLDVESLARRADNERQKLRTMIEYAYYPRCRRQLVLDYFGDQDWTSRDRTCGACDNCEAIAHGRPPTGGLTDQEQKAIRGVLLLVGSLCGRFGRTRVAAIALGDDHDPRFLDLVERGCLRGWQQRQVLDLLRSLEGSGLIEASRGEYPTISTTRRGDQVAVGQIDPVSLGIAMPIAGRANKRGKPKKLRAR